MKTFFLLFLLIPMLSQGQNQLYQVVDTLDHQIIELRSDSLYYKSKIDKPYSGWGLIISGFFKGYGPSIEYVNGVKVNQVEYYAQGQKKTEETFVGRYEGIASEWYSNGQLKSRGPFKYSALYQTGLWTNWYPSGNKKSEINFDNNIPGYQEGLSTTWYENGQKESEGIFSMKKDGKLGLWTTWYENGHKKSEEHFSLNLGSKKDGQNIEWFDNGQKKLEGTYKGQWEWKEDIWTSWYQNGQKEFEVLYVEDNEVSMEGWDAQGIHLEGVITVLDEEKQLEFERNFVGGKEISYTALDKINELKETHTIRMEKGVWTRFYQNGSKQAEGKFVNGIREGLWTKWYDTGKMQSEGNYINGKMEGVSMSWHANGLKELEGKYSDGNKEGLWTEWYEKGKKAGEKYFVSGEVVGLWVVWHQNGQKAYELTYISRKNNPDIQEPYDGVRTAWYESSIKKYEYHYTMGIRNGTFTEWYENGKKREELEYLNGNQVGSIKYWDEKGKQIIH